MYILITYDVATDDKAGQRRLGSEMCIRDSLKTVEHGLCANLKLTRIPRQVGDWCNALGIED